MEKVPTAEDILSKKFNELRSSFTLKDVEECMIEFAKLHVEAAIKACIEDAPSGSSTDTVSQEDVVEALKDSYPLENIK
jgi:hypothetical protein